MTGNDVDLVIRRRKRRLTEQDSRYKKTFWARLSCLCLCALFSYILGAVFSPWAGLWGRSVGDLLLRSVGGSVVVPLMFIIYTLFGMGTGRFLRNLKGQLLGTVCLFLSFLILTGFMDIAGSSYRLGKPGWLGFHVSLVTVGFVGVLGSLLIGLSLVGLAAVFYDVIPVERKGFRFFSRGLYLAALGIVMKLRNFKLKRKRDFIDEDVDHTQDDLPLSMENSTVTKEKKVTPVINLLRQPYRPKDEHEEELEDISEDPPEPRVFAKKRGLFEKPTVVQVEGDVDSESSLPVETKDEYPTEISFSPLPMELLGPERALSSGNDPMVLRQKGLDIVTALANFGVEAELANTMEGPTVVQYQIQLAPGVKVSKVAGLSKDLAVAMAAQSLRVEAPIPGTSYVGIEVPNGRRRPVTLRSVMESEEFCDNNSMLPLPLGLAIDGSPMVVGLEDLPHLLVAGTTGSGKSVFVSSCITALCATRSPMDLRFILIDPKRVEMAMYEKLPHVLAKPIVEPQKAVQALGWAVKEMERRYETFARLRVKNLEGYNGKSEDKLPHIVVVVDELADLMFTASKDVEDYICRLAQMARATGIHLLLATQRPSVNVITGLIKANIPARAAFTLPSQTDSRTIIDVSGAQQLLGKGDMLFTSTKYPKPIRVQAPFIDEDSSFKVIDSLRETFGDPKYVDLEDPKVGNGTISGNLMEDERLEEAIMLVMQSGIASASRLQRQMRIGFTRAARMIDIMEQMGIIGPQEGSKPREIYVDEEKVDEMMEQFRR